MRTRKSIATIIVSVCALAGCFVDTSAQALVVHNYIPGAVPQLAEGVPAEGPHGEAVPLPGPLTLNASSMTIDSGHLWIAEAAGILGNGNIIFRIDEFNASTGAFIAQVANSERTPQYGGFGIAVGHATGEEVTYVGEGIGSNGQEAAVAVFDEAGAQKTWTGAGTLAGSFGESGLDVAVDGLSSPLDEHQGDVYVADGQQGVIDIFHPEPDGEEHYVGQVTAEQITGFPAGEAFQPGKLAVSAANGDLVVQNASVYDILEPAALGQYTLVGTIAATPGGPLNPVNVTVDGASGEIYAIDGSNPAVVDQFNSTGAYLGRVTGADTPSGLIGNAFSLAIDPESHELYVGDAQVRAGAPIDVFGPDVVQPDVTTGPASSTAPTSATLNGTVNPDDAKAGATKCQFQWGTSRSFGQIAPCEPEEVAEGANHVPVHTTLRRLQPDTTYYYRLQAGNQNGTNPGEPREDQELTTPGPGIHHESVANVAATSATVQAAIDPHTAPTTYYFQYGTSRAYGIDVPVLGGGAPRGLSIGSGTGDAEVAQHLQELQVDTVYHYRVVAVSEPAPGQYEEFDGPDQTFTTQKLGGELALADNRAWQMVTPPEKNGANLEPINLGNGKIQAASAGDAFTYVANTPVETEPQGFAGVGEQELSVRGPGGWAPVTITVPHIAATGQPIGYGPEYRSFSDDLSRAAIQPLGVFNPSLSVEASEQTSFLRTAYLNGNVDEPCTQGCYRPLVTGAAGYSNVPVGTRFGGSEGAVPPPSATPCQIGCGPNFVGATPDMSHVVLKAVAGLTAGAGSEGGLYEWSAGRLAFIGQGFVGNPASRADRHSISDDGSRIVVTGSAEGLEGLLMRDMANGETVKLDAVQGGTGAKDGLFGPLFQAASSDGSRVLFTDRQALTKDAGGSGVEPHLYECEMVREVGTLACKLSDLTPGESAEVQGGVLGVSEDASWVYFATRGKLGAEGDAGINLYVLHFDGNSWEQPRLIAALSEEDLQDWSETLSGQPARVSPDGRWLEFMSQASLTGYDNRDALNGRPDAEVYLYNSSTRHLVCASCDPTGARPVGRESHSLGLVGGPDGIWPPNGWVAANVPGWQQSEIAGAVQDYQSRYLSDEGRLFFNTNDALVPQDVNGTEDVYEFEPAGVGSCTTASVTFSERSGGCVGLVSSGTSPTESAFLDASEGGGDVFFMTGERMVSQDFDTSLDIYDAHECTAQAPCAKPVALPPPCSTGDACKPAPTPQPASFGAPASATFSGAGNVTPSGGGVAVRKSLTETQRLARALKACRKKGRGQRAVCERKARKRYAAKRSRKVNRTRGKRG